MTNLWKTRKIFGQQLPIIIWYIKVGEIQRGCRLWNLCLISRLDWHLLILVISLMRRAEGKKREVCGFLLYKCSKYLKRNLRVRPWSLWPSWLNLSSKCFCKIFHCFFLQFVILIQMEGIWKNIFFKYQIEIVVSKTKI